MTTTFDESIVALLDRRGFLKGTALIGAATLGASLVGCGAEDISPSPEGGDGGTAPAAQAESVAPEAAGNSNDPQAVSTEVSGPASKTAVVYFSVPLTDSQTRDADSGASIVVSGDDLWGNVQYAAQFVADATGGDLLRIQLETPYATDDSIFDYALEEQNANARPAISLVAADGSVVDSLDAYDTVCVGYPIWWYELPMPLYTFFENYDLSGKRVAPFVVHGGSGLSGTVQDIEALQPDAQVVEDGLSISRSNVQETAEARVAEWVGAQGL